MWFSNLQVYRLAGALDLHALEAAVTRDAFVPAGSNEVLRQGWSPVRADWPTLTYMINRQILMRFDSEERSVPAAHIKRVAHERALVLEEEQGFAPGKKVMKELRERIHDELLPRAFPRLSHTFVWIDPDNNWLVVDTASTARADDVVKSLLKHYDRFPIESLRVQCSPAATMTAWLENDEAPAGFTVDQDTELRATGESRAAVRYIKHTLDPADVGRHIAAGKQCTRLALTWEDKISFVLTESLAIKSLQPLDILTEREIVDTDAATERFDSDMVLMTAELAALLADVVAALGGEVVA